MKLFMPLADGHGIPNKTLHSIIMQSVDMTLVPCCAPGFMKKKGTVMNMENVHKKVTGEVASRNVMIKIIKDLKLKHKYVAMQDRDCVHLRHDNFARCISYLDEKASRVAVSLPKDKIIVGASHVSVTCVVFRVDFLKSFKWRDEPEWHVCESLAKDVLEAGKIYGYLPSDVPLISTVKTDFDIE